MTTFSRIKTNGSLPRETRLGSPPLTLSGSPVRKSSFNQIYSEEEVNGFFSFLAFEGKPVILLLLGFKLQYFIVLNEQS